jgi:hypothetical protein
MSTLKADTIVASDGSSPVTLTKQSAAKAFASVQGTGSGAPIRNSQSLNVSSTTDSGSGDYEVAFSNSMDSADLCITTADSNNANVASATHTRVDTDATTGYGTQTYYNGSLSDASWVNTIVMGDLA